MHLTTSLFDLLQGLCIIWALQSNHSSRYKWTVEDLRLALHSSPIVNSCNLITDRIETLDGISAIVAFLEVLVERNLKKNGDDIIEVLWIFCRSGKSFEITSSRFRRVFFRAAKAAGTVRCLSLHSLHATLINLSSYADYISYWN